MRKGLRLLAVVIVCLFIVPATTAYAYPTAAEANEGQDQYPRIEDNVYYARSIASKLSDTRSEYLKKITDKDLPRLWNDAVLKGKLPVAAGYASAVLEKAVNDKVQEAYTALLTKAGETASAIDFSYEAMENEGYVSILLHCKSVSAFPQESYSCIVFSKKTEKLVGLNDVLGPNGVKLANRVLAEQVKANPERFNPTIADITVTHDFYMENSHLVLVFDQFEIAPGSEGVVRVSIALEGLTGFSVDKTEHYPSAASQFSVKMIPLRSVAAAFGYDVVWNADAQTADLKKDGQLVTSVTIGENSYYKTRSPKRRLEVAPEVHLGKTHVPISFFEEILGLLYHVDSHGNIMLTDYTAPAVESAVKQ